MNTILSTLFIVLAAWFVISRFLPVKGVQNINGKRIEKYSGEKEKYFIDVRTIGEYRGNHMKGFQNIP